MINNIHANVFKTTIEIHPATRHIVHFTTDSLEYLLMPHNHPYSKKIQDSGLHLSFIKLTFLIGESERCDCLPDIIKKFFLWLYCSMQDSLIDDLQQSTIFWREVGNTGRSESPSRLVLMILSCSGGSTSFQIALEDLIIKECIVLY